MNTACNTETLIDQLLDCRVNDFEALIDHIHKGIGFVLYQLDKADGEVIAGDLAAKMQVSTARIASLLKTMESKQLIVRRQSPVDSRKIIVELTNDGRYHLDELKAELRQKVEFLISCIGYDDMAEYIRITRGIRSALESNRSAPIFK